MADRAVLFIDGNNWYHSLRHAGVGHRIDLDYAAISEKLIGPREWAETRYYIGAMKQSWNPRDYAYQRKFLSLIQQDDDRISVHFGRLEERPKENPLADELREYLRANEENIGDQIVSDLRKLVEEHQDIVVLKEKAADVMLAVDMYRMGIEDEYDAAYLLSADGDYTPVVKAVRDIDKKVYVASPLRCTALQNVARAFITLNSYWFDDCYRGRDPRVYAVDVDS